MHPALIILAVVTFVHITGLIGRERIEAIVRPIYLRLLYSGEVKRQKKLKQNLLATRQQLRQTSSQDEFAKWAKLRRSVDKMVNELEASNGVVQGAASSVSLLVRAILFLATTLFPFCLTFYYGKTPMFFLPPSGATPVASSSHVNVVKRAPGGFEIPRDPGHAWSMVNETYLGPIGWILCMTAAPRGSVSAGIWSTVCTRVVILITNQIKVLLALAFATSSSSGSKPTLTEEDVSTAGPAATTTTSAAHKGSGSTDAYLRKRNVAAAAPAASTPT